MKTAKYILAVALLSLGVISCSTLKNIASKGVNVVASIGTNTLGLLDIGAPLVQDPAHPDDPTATVVNPAIVGAAQGAATTFGGPYGVPIAAVLGIVAGIIGTIATEKKRKASK